MKNEDLTYLMAVRMEQQDQLGTMEPVHLKF